MLMSCPSWRNVANRSAEAKAPIGVQRPMIMAASAMKPRPFVMPIWNEFVASMLRKAPPRPANMPPIMTFR